MTTDEIAAEAADDKTHDGSKGFFGFSCDHCGNYERVSSPIPINAWLVWAKGYIKTHKRCKPK